MGPWNATWMRVILIPHTLINCIFQENLMINYHLSNLFHLTVRISSRQGLNFGMHLKACIPLAEGLMMSCKLVEEEESQSWTVQTMEGTTDSRTEIWCALAQKLISRFWNLDMIWILGTISERPMCMAPQGPIVAYPKIVEPGRDSFFHNCLERGTPEIALNI